MIVKRCVLIVVCALCLILPQGVMAAKGNVTVLFTGDLLGQATPLHG